VLLTKKAQPPTNVLKVRAYSIPSFSPPNPSAPHNVNPIAPMKFQNPTCQPSSLGAGSHHFSCTSSMNSKLEMMKPVPPTTWGSQYAPFRAGVELERVLLI
jgi:hypothetical protein